VPALLCRSAPANHRLEEVREDLHHVVDHFRRQADCIPFLDKMREGEILFDLGNGRLHRAVIKVDKELKGHMGENSSYRFQSSLVEQLMADR
jgi:hypothetical protein